MNILKTEQKNDCLFITIEVTNIDSFNYIVIKAKILSYLKEHKNIILDLSNINHLDSWGIGTLISLNANVKDSQKFVIVCPSPEVYEKLKASGLTNYFHIIYEPGISKCPICSNINCAHINTICDIFMRLAKPPVKSESKLVKIIKTLTSSLNPAALAKNFKNNSPLSHKGGFSRKVVKALTGTLKQHFEKHKEKSPVVKIVRSLTGKLDETIFKKFSRGSSVPSVTIGKLEDINKPPLVELVKENNKLTVPKQELGNENLQILKFLNVNIVEQASCLSIKKDFQGKQTEITEDLKEKPQIEEIEQTEPEEAEKFEPEETEATEIADTEEQSVEAIEFYYQQNTIFSFFKKYGSVIACVIFIISFIVIIYVLQINKKSDDSEDIKKKFTPAELLEYDMDKDGIFTKHDWYMLSPQSRIELLKKYRKKKK